jgi:hypothetical protein
MIHARAIGIDWPDAARSTGVAAASALEGSAVQAAATMEELEIVRQRLEALKQEHRDLDDVIARVTEAGPFDQLQVQRLKKRKLVLKDQIMKLESELHPDIIA